MVEKKIIFKEKNCTSSSHLVIAADCSAFASAGRNNEFNKDEITLVGCHKFNRSDYEAKLVALFHGGRVEDITILRKEKPCCDSLVMFITEFLGARNQKVECKIVTLSSTGKVMGD